MAHAEEFSLRFPIPWCHTLFRWTIQNNLVFHTSFGSSSSTLHHIVANNYRPHWLELLGIQNDPHRKLEHRELILAANDNSTISIASHFICQSLYKNGTELRATMKEVETGNKSGFKLYRGANVGRARRGGESTLLLRYELFTLLYYHWLLPEAKNNFPIRIDLLVLLCPEICTRLPIECILSLCPAIRRKVSSFRWLRSSFNLSWWNWLDMRNEIDPIRFPRREMEWNSLTMVGWENRCHFHLTLLSSHYSCSELLLLS